MKLYDVEDTAQVDITDSGQNNVQSFSKNKFKTLKV